MTISYVGVGALNAISGSSGTQTYEWPTSYTPVAGDLAFVVQAGWWVMTDWNLGPYGPTPTGFTNLAKYERDSTATRCLGISLHYRFLDGSEDIPTVSTASTYTEILEGFTFVFSGVHNSSTFDGTATKSSGSGSTTFQVASMTTNAANEMAFLVVTAGNDVAIAGTSLNSWTVRASGASYDTTTGSDGAMAFATKFMAAAGSTSVLGWTGTSATNWVGMGVRLKPASAPDAPTSVTATPNAIKGFALSWNAPGDNGQTISQYTVQWSTDNATWTTYGTSTTNSLTVTDPGSWSNNTLYYFQVKATNSIGDSSYSTSGSGTTWTVPGAPTAVTIGTVTSATIDLSWTAPASNGGSAITDYIVQYSLDGSSWSTFSDGTSTTTSTTVTGLTSSTLYYFRIAAVSAVGTGSYSTSASTTTLQEPIYWGISAL